MNIQSEKIYQENLTYKKIYNSIMPSSSEIKKSKKKLWARSWGRIRAESVSCVSASAPDARGWGAKGGSAYWAGTGQQALLGQDCLLPERLGHHPVEVMPA